MISRNCKLCALIVTFYPNQETINGLIERLLKQVARVVVIDNTPEKDMLVSSDIVNAFEHITVLHNGKNLGIAAAHNIGIKWAKKHGFDYVILFDQDSKPTYDMIAKLFQAYNNLTVCDEKIAAVGPQCFDLGKKNYMFFTKFRKYRLRKLRHRESNKTNTHLVDYVITSGSLIPIHVFDAVGAYNESFFIDYVDIEWCLRAQNRGFKCYGVTSTVMEHRLGDRVINFFGRKISVHSPLRHYYMVRNSIRLYQKPYPGWMWKLNDFTFLCMKFCFYSLFTKPRWQHFRMMTLGLWHGLRGRMGQYETAVSGE